MKQSVPQDLSHPETVRLMQQAHQTHFLFKTAPKTIDLPLLPANFAVDPQQSEFIGTCRRRTYYGQEGTFAWD